MRVATTVQNEGRLTKLERARGQDPRFWSHEKRFEQARTRIETTYASLDDYALVHRDWAADTATIFILTVPLLVQARSLEIEPGPFPWSALAYPPDVPLPVAVREALPSWPHYTDRLNAAQLAKTGRPRFMPVSDKSDRFHDVMFVLALGQDEAMTVRRRIWIENPEGFELLDPLPAVVDPSRLELARDFLNEFHVTVSKKLGLWRPGTYPDLHRPLRAREED